MVFVGHKGSLCYSIKHNLVSARWGQKQVQLVIQIMKKSLGRSLGKNVWARTEKAKEAYHEKTVCRTGFLGQKLEGGNIHEDV